MLGSAVVYAGLLLSLAGGLSVLRPLRFLRIETRRTGAVVLGAGIAVVLIGFVLPARERRPSGPPSRLDDFSPVFQFDEFHEARIHASPEHVWAALKAVTAEEIRLYRLLTWIRKPHLPSSKKHEGVFAPPRGKPILDVFLRSGFVLLAEEPPRELVVGTIACCGRSGVLDAREFAELRRPGFAKAAMNFSLEDEGGGWTHLTTETRVYATDTSARRIFTAYWRVIYPGSALIRRGWLRAVKERAERGSS